MFCFCPHSEWLVKPVSSLSTLIHLMPLTQPSPCQTNIGKWRYRISGEFWSCLSLCFLQNTVKVIVVENGSVLETAWWCGILLSYYRQHCTNSYGPVSLPILLPSFMVMNEKAMQKTSQDGRFQRMLFCPPTPNLLGHSGQWCWEY